ncbi:tryptophan 2,3-dioxygenase family protein [Streptomyces sp. NPDC051014]|uniref:tryptophan 2,3-dioxygenase n=1 Tax=Streptomyces sp. NPDC051014 TaxID=3155751 RepID=UPI0033E5881C
MNDGPTAAAELSPDDPLVQPFTGPSPYDDYVRATLLNTLQKPLTEAAVEMGFLVTTQVMELWFTLIAHEWRAAREAFAKDRLPDAMDALLRSRHAAGALNCSWLPIAGLTPAQFNELRPAFGKASGFQSAMYRHLEFLLGEKSAALLRSHHGDPVVYEGLREAYHEPSLYDEVLRFLHRRGLPVPEVVRERDVTTPYTAHQGVVAAWRHVYAAAEPHPLLALAELLTDLAELVTRWRFDHVMVVRRAMGTKGGTAGSAGLHWLEQRATRPVFPELWTVRGDV